MLQDPSNAVVVLAKFAESEALKHASNPANMEACTYIAPRLRVSDFRMLPDGDVWGTPRMETQAVQGRYFKDSRPVINLILNSEPFRAACLVLEQEEGIPAEVDRRRELTALVETVVMSAANGIAASDLATEFLANLRGEALTQDVHVWLRGILMDVERIEITPKLILRRSQASDLESMNIAQGFPLQLPTAVLEIIDTCRPDSDQQNYIDAALRTLRLFKVGAVRQMGVRRIPKVALFGSMNAATIYNLPIVASQSKYRVGKDDVPILSQFTEQLLPQLHRIQAAPRTSEDKYLSIACKRYDLALLNTEEAEHTIAEAVICLESLLLKPNEKSHQKENLAKRGQRMPLLIGAGVSPDKVRKDLNRAYEIRSNYLHGAVSDEGKQGSAATLVKPVLNYARLALLSFIFLAERYSKIALIDDLDRSDARKFQILDEFGNSFGGCRTLETK